MILISLIGALILGFALGRNNFSNLFGTAVGTRMIQLRTAAIGAVIFIVIGALTGSAATTESVMSFSSVQTPTDLVIVVFSAALILELLSHQGIPASIVQTIIGSLIGFDLYHQSNIDWKFMWQLTAGWFFAPFLAAAFGWALIHLIRKILIRYPISLFKRDKILRAGLMTVGLWAAYALGANNIGTITAPYIRVYMNCPPVILTIMVCIGIGIGCCLSNKKVIETVGKRLFPLSPTEALITMTASTISMICFSAQNLQHTLAQLHLPVFPLVPIPMSSVMVGSICGIALSKGGYGLRFHVLMRIILSWFLVPLIGACFCLLILKIGSLL